ncbi:hypothetical protein SUGI_0072210 [Cryptomeria japonica]|nr:hypothetical protein SUGI_0072210 [Cryptomeria japonica]
MSLSSGYLTLTPTPEPDSSSETVGCLFLWPRNSLEASRSSLRWSPAVVLKIDQLQNFLPGKAHVWL